MNSEIIQITDLSLSTITDLSLSTITDLSLSTITFTRAYFEGFLDISGGNLFLQKNNEKPIPSKCQFLINNCDISLNGQTYETGDLSINFNFHFRN
jgi:hypothetical protein